MCWIEKRFTLFNGLEVIYQHEKFGEDRTARAGCRCENMVFVFVFFCHAPRPTRCLFEGVYFEQVLYYSLWVDFDDVFSVFFVSDCTFRCTTYFPFLSLDSARTFAKFWSKIAKTFKKICGKVCAHHFV